MERELKHYYIEDTATGLWFMVKRAYENIYWTDNPNRAKDYGSMSNGWAHIEKGFRYSDVNPFEGKDLIVVAYDIIETDGLKQIKG